MGEWQLIESAPKDGSSILGFVPLATGYRVVSLRWAEDKRWRADVHSFVQFSPTHWQPLPAPPSQEEG
jgi:hypothetical protein